VAVSDMRKLLLSAVVYTVTVLPVTENGTGFFSEKENRMTVNEQVRRIFFMAVGWVSNIADSSGEKNKRINKPFP